MFAGLCVVAILLWIASALQKSELGTVPATTQPAAAEPADDIAFYLVGHVAHPRGYPLPHPETISTAIAAAGGAQGPAEDLVVRVMRKSHGKAITHSIPMSQILSGQADEAVVRGDVIDVVQQIKPATVRVSPLPSAVPGLTNSIP
jgi:hypothetical protein